MFFLVSFFVFFSSVFALNKAPVDITTMSIDDINDVEKFKKAELFVTREDAVPLAEDEYFIADLIDITVTSDEGEELGTISDVLQTGANDVYVISKPNTPDLLVPAIKECIKEVNLEEATMLVHLLPGLRD